MLVAGFLFACMGLLVKLGASHFSSIELVFYRSLVGFLLVATSTSLMRRKLQSPHLPRQIVRASLGFIALLLFFECIHRLPLASAITLNYTSPLFLAVLSPLLLGENASKVLYLSLLIGFAGIVLLLKPDLQQGQYLATGIGLLSGLLAGIVYTQVTQLGRLGEPDWRTVFYFCLVSTVGSGAILLVQGFHWPDLAQLPILLGVGMTATLAQLAMTRAYRTGHPVIVGSLAYSTVAFASLFGFFMWHEALSPWQWLGIALVVAGGMHAIYSRPLKPRLMPR